MHRYVLITLLAQATACAPEAEACADACEALVRTCRFAAYPNVESCEQGCAVDASRGSAVGAMASCVVDAGCDTHAVVACARASSPTQ